MEAAHYTPEQLNERFQFRGYFVKLTIALLVLGAIILGIGIATGNSSPSAHGHDAHGAVEQSKTVHTVSDPHGQPETHAESHDQAHAQGHEGGHHKVVTLATRIWSSLLLNNMFYFTLAIGAMVFLLISTLTGGGWLTVLRRIPEAMMSYLPVAFVLFLVIIFAGGVHELYEWSWLAAGQDALIDAKRAVLNNGFFTGASILFFAVWGFVAWRMRSLSVNEDLEGGLKAYNGSLATSAFGLIFFALSFSLFAVLWVKSLEPHWFSTIFGVYMFVGCAVSAVTTIHLIVNVLKSEGYLGYVNDSHKHDLGKFMFGFSVFWAYIWVSQFLLIWYSNIPEETIYYIRRMGGDLIQFNSQGIYETYTASSEYMGYKALFFANLIVNFLVPFLVLMTRNAKRTAFIVAPLAVLMLLGHWTDLFLLIMPGTVGAEWHLGMIEFGMFLLLGGVFCAVTFFTLSRAALVPKNNPYLEESLHHSTGVI